MDKASKAPEPVADTVLTPTDLETNEGKVILSDKINKEIDKIFGPAVQRNRSGSDIEIIVPYRRRHYWSQERLFSDKPLQQSQVGDVLNQGLNSFQIDELKSLDESKSSQIPVLHENQRAEIIASVTERLYSKLKKNEKSTPKIETVFDRKGIQPLSELKICSNARQRLMELSQKALRNKRRIGIPAYTQTRSQVTRVKNQGIEIQTDLQSLVDLTQPNLYSLRKDASIQTEFVTPRLKEKAVGSNYDCVNCINKDTATQTNTTTHNDNMTMTPVVMIKNDSTQTVFHKNKSKRDSLPAKECASTIDFLQREHKDTGYLSPSININISPFYYHESEYSSDSEVFTEDEYESLADNILIFDNTKTNDKNVTDTSVCEKEVQNEFSDDDCMELPRVVVDTIRNTDIGEYEELLLGRNEDIYPYNITLSPCKKIDDNQRAIKFKDDIKTVAAGEDDDVANDKGSCTELHNIILTAPEYSIELVTDEAERIQSTIHNDQTKLQSDNESNCYSNEVNECHTIGHCSSPIRLQTEFLTDEIDSDTAIYCSLNSFFKSRRKRTPTEYLHYLIQKRREAISLENSRFYRRNVSF